MATRRVPQLFPEFVAQYGGDTLWAAMVFWLGALAWRRASTGRLALGALAISYVVEVSQLYRAPWIDALRASSLGALVLGQGFLWSDLLCYAVGVVLTAVLDAGVTRAAASPE